MKNWLWVLVVLCVATACSGGGRPKSIILDIPDHSLSRSNFFFVKDFDTSSTLFKGDYTDIPERVNSERSKIPVMITSDLIAQLQLNGFRAQKYETAPTQEGELIIDGDVFEVDHGSAASRFWIGMGAGASSIKTHVRIYKANGNILIGDYTFVSSSGAKGGGLAWQDFVSDNARRIAYSIASYMARKAGS